MFRRSRHDPLRSASFSLWALGILYLMVGLLAFVVEAFRWPSLWSFASASVWLLPGAAYLLAASYATPGRLWPLAVGLACTVVVTLGLMLILGWALWYAGVAELVAWRKPLESQIVLLVVLLIVHQAYLIYNLIAAWRAAAEATGRGFDIGVPMPVRTIDREDAATGPTG